jgi:hypothetical protein
MRWIDYLGRKPEEWLQACDQVAIAKASLPLVRNARRLCPFLTLPQAKLNQMTHNISLGIERRDLTPEIIATGDRDVMHCAAAYQCMP